MGVITSREAGSFRRELKDWQWDVVMLIFANARLAFLDASHHAKQKRIYCRSAGVVGGVYQQGDGFRFEVHECDGRDKPIGRTIADGKGTLAVVACELLSAMTQSHLCWVASVISDERPARPGLRV